MTKQQQKREQNELYSNHVHLNVLETCQCISAKLEIHFFNNKLKFVITKHKEKHL